mmetsp:Transcript_17427/g.37634  ORF Transcript_17427/g.37634 Transcript_17427/m.37634 type:complete len:226 (+) Transcript_17427:162-839(+)|eukprot:CAMPEP_0172312216 /NCGR_PEP_ID=MMETSP1058-20130122/17038_1 /TAXON_ID=83371 /ORGANISM="Detonula confervacea, Strain CCMP 353" /LENGTH=225 /DNA_ID=CAMNT_0013025611 /DNA_START=104 /DNA_END=781 /DNA_ORIENTATION=-
MKASVSATHSSLALRILSLRTVLSLALFAQTMPLVLCRSFSTTLQERRSAAFVSTPFPTSSLSLHQSIRKVNNPLMAIDPITSFNIDSNFLLAASDTSTPPMAVSELQDNLQIEQLSPTTTIFVFIIGVIPFIWATWEFWRRIAVGASFGTGSDSVVIPSPFEDDSNNDNNLISIGEDNNPNSSRGRQTLDRGALTVAYVLFAVAGGTVAIAIASVVMGPQANPL